MSTFVLTQSAKAESRLSSQILSLMAPTSPNPPSPVPFVSTVESTSPTWDEYLANSSNNSFDLAFPVNLSFEDPVPRETRPPYPSTGPSYSGYPRRLSPAPINHKRKASPLPSGAVAFPMIPDTMPPVVTFPLSVMRPETLAQSEMKTVPMKTTSNPDTPTATQVGRWTKREHELFLEGLQRFGKSWKKISSLVHTRTLVQIRTHAQKYLQKQTRAAIKADAKAAEAALRTSQSRSTFQQQKRQHRDILPPKAAGPPTLQMNAPTLRQWKSPPSGDRSDFAPLAHPPHSTFQLHSVNRLDQLLQDDNTIPAFVDEHYTSPTAIEDDLLRPLYTGEQWVQHLAQSTSTSYSNKRRRVEPSASSAPISTSIAVPTLRPAIPNAPFEPLPAPNNLSSPNNNPSAAAAALLAAHETDETTNYTNAWL